MPHTFFDSRRISTLIALLLIIALAAIMFASAPAETQTSPTDATATPTATGTATPTPTPTGTATATGTPTPTATADPNATATPTGTATATATATATSTATPTPTPTATPTVPPANADYDADNDGLIEIRTLPQLNAIRYDLNGNGKQDSVSAADWTTYTTAFLNAASDMGCKLTDHDSNAATPQQATCTGYELMLDLDFDTNGDKRVDSTDPNSYPVWTPIGTAANPFNATFKSDSNGSIPQIAKISNFTITGSSTEVGLFGATGSNARIEGIGLVGVHVSPETAASAAKIGTLVGSNAGRITACYSAISVIFADARTGSYAGGLVGYNTGTIAASFSRTDVSIDIDDAVTGRMDISAGGLAGYNSGTLTAVYSLGAVRGNGRSDTYGYVGGLVGDNSGTITASYSIGPVTADTASAIAVGGLTGRNSTQTATITASYWDYISSGIDDDSDAVMPEGKSTRDLKSPTSATGIYADWDDLTIDGANDVDPWNFSHTALHPQLTYGGHTTTRDISGNQRLAGISIRGQHGGSAVRPREGMTFGAGGAGGYPPHGLRDGVWIWESSPDGINWTILSPLPGKRAATLRGIGGDFGGTHFFVPMPEHIGKYIRTRILLTTGEYLISRTIGKIKAADTAPALSFVSVLFSPRVEWEITIESLPSGAVGLWYRCDTNTAKPPTTGCELVGSRASYTPETLDVDHYLYAYIYYKNASGAWLRSDVGFTQNKVGGFRGSQWRSPSD